MKLISMTRNYIFSLGLALLFQNQSLAYYEHLPSTPQVMNGIKYSSYPNFQKKWELVTVRYRKDSNEVRFVYANSIAVQGLKSLKPQYPDGAVFAKIGFKGEEDPAFTSSIVPSGARRVQFMVKDSKKYADSDGWGYALFDQNGNTFNEDLKKTTMGCVACHRLVPERDYVFSRPVFVKDSLKTLVRKSETDKSLLSFKEIGVKDFQGDIVKIIESQKITKIESMTGEIQKNAFSGTLDEAVPLLLERSKMFSKPSLLFIDKDNFSFIVPLKSEECLPSGEAFQVSILFNGKFYRNSKICK